MTEPTATEIADIRLDNSLTRAQILAMPANAENHLFIASDTGDIFICDKNGAIKELTPSTKSASDPTVNDASDTFHSVMETWLNTVSGAYFICVDDTPTSAVWLPILGGFVSEALTGTVDGVNTTFTIPSGDVVNDQGLAFWNGRLADDNYTITGDTVEFTVAPALNTELWFVGNIALSGNPAIVKASNYLLVSKTGGDYDNIEDALSAVGTTSASNRWAIDVAPGEYTITSALQGKEYVSISGLGDKNTIKIIQSTPNTNIFNSVDFFTVSNITFEGVSGTGWVLSHTVAGNASINNCGILDCSNGINVNNSSCNVVVNEIRFSNPTVTLLKGVFVEAGICISDTIRSVTGTVTTLFEGTGSGSIIGIKNLETFNSSVNTCIYLRDQCRTVITNVSIAYANNGIVAQGGANVKVNGGAIFDSTTDGLRINNTGSDTDVTVQAVNIEDSGQWDLNLLSATCTISGGGKIPSDMINTVPGAQMYMVNITLKEGDEGTDIFGELHVGRPEKGEETVLGGGDSYTRGMLVYEYNGSTFTDVSTEARSASSSTFTFPGITADNAVYIASSLLSADGVDVLEHYGIKTKITTGAVVGTGEIVAEYWNGSAWVEVNAFETDEEIGRYPHAKDYFTRTGSAQIRYDPALATDTWTKSDPVGEGVSYYWMRFRIATAITTAPIFEQFKLHTSRSEINSDGYIEYMGKARPIGQLPFFIGQDKALAGNLGDQSLWINQDIGSGLKENNFNATGDTIGRTFFMPQDLDTSGVISMKLVGRPAGTGTTEFTVRIASVTDGGIISTSNPALTPGSFTQVVSQSVTAGQASFFDFSLDVSNYLSRRSGGQPDVLSITIEATSLGGGAFAMFAIEAEYTKWTNGGHVG